MDQPLTAAERTPTDEADSIDAGEILSFLRPPRTTSDIKSLVERYTRISAKEETLQNRSHSSREVDDVAGSGGRSRFEHKHAPRLDIATLAGFGVGAEVLGERPLELKGNPASHCSDAVHRVDQRFGVFRNNIADLESNHRHYSRINITYELDLDSGLVSSCTDGATRLLKCLRRPYTDPPDQEPREQILHQKLLLPLLLGPASLWH